MGLPEFPADSVVNRFAGRSVPAHDVARIDGSRIPPKRGLPTAPRLLRALEIRLDLLRARGLRIPKMDLARPYACFLVSRVLMLTPAPESETGYDAKATAGTRYRILGLRPGDTGGTVVVPGVPDRRFDRMVAVSFGEGFGVTRAWQAPANVFLRAAHYDPTVNRWSASLDDPVWSSREVQDLTAEIRCAAAQAESEQDLRHIDPVAGLSLSQAPMRDGAGLT